MKAVEERINQYLDEIQSHLQFLSEEEKEEILISVRSHIDEQVGAISQGQPTLEILETVLQEMDSPESYAESVAEFTSSELKSQRISRLAILGAILLPFGIIAAMMTFMVSPTSGNGSVTLWQWIARLTILPLGILAPFACTTLGLMAISRIRNSEGTLIGMPLAFSVGLFYPILIADFAIFWIVATVFSSEDYWNIVFGVSIILLLILDFLIIRTAWQAIKIKR